MQSQSRLVSFGILVLCVAFVLPASLRADEGDEKLRAVPFTFVGNPGDCGPTAGSRIVTAAWLTGMGLPDNGGPNVGPLPLSDTQNKRDPHLGLLLSKNGPTPDCSAAGARIEGVRGMEVGATFTLGFDYRNGGHCGAGAPRFNVVTRAGGVDTFHFVGGCANGVQTPASQDPLEWTQTRFLALAEFPPILPGSRIQSISIIYDEGTDTPSVQDPMGVGLAVLDNIYVNGAVIRSGPSECPNGDNGNDDH